MRDDVVTVEAPRASEENTRQDELRVEAHEAAAGGEATPGPGTGKSLIADLQADQEFFQAASAHFRHASGEQALSYAAEWLLDNSFLAQQGVREIREDMPPGYYRQLPKLTSGALQGYPRVYDIAQRLVARSDARLDLEEVREYVSFYQDTRPLTTGELWALPVMLRLTLLDHLGQYLSQITRLPRPVDRPRLALRSDLTADAVVANCFMSLRAMAAYDWRQFFEDVSRLEQALRADPAAVYGRMDRDSRDRYRKIVEEMALTSGLDELRVAKAALELAAAAAGEAGRSPQGVTKGQAAPDLSEVSRTAHVGYYLFGPGRSRLDAALAYHPSLPQRLERWALRHPTPTYLVPIGMLALLALYAAWSGTRTWGATWAQGILVLALVLAPAVTVAVAIVDWFLTLLVPARVLPKLDFSSGRHGGIPAECRTLIVVPALLGSSAEAGSLLEQLELHYLRNPDDGLFFGLLTDFPDAPEQHLPGDDELLDRLRAGIRGLNERHGAGQEDRFCLFHRERRLNEREGVWMGWERKRGKLHELNRWLRGATDTSFVVADGPLETLRSVKYVITLDADTILGRDGAAGLVGALAHPLNRARLDPRTGHVVEGYGVLQPRTEILPTSANRSHFSRIFAGTVGLDLYTLAVSNVYQDLFGSGIYIGKGIYDVDAFERALAGRVPENSLLSHDLFEGLYARAGLVTDIVLYEEYPPSYPAYMQRLHRWVRGDWQVAPWLLPQVPSTECGWVPNTLSPIGRWKILDNLRRSLLPAALLLLFIAAWIVLPGPGWAWTVAAMLVPAVPVLLAPLTPFFTGMGNAPFRRAARSLTTNVERWLLAFVFLPYEAFQMLDAIGVTLLRMLTTRTGLLKWTTSAEAAREGADNDSRLHAWMRMRSAFAFSFVISALVLILRPEHLPVVLPIASVWALGPEISFRVSVPIRRAVEPLDSAQTAALRSLARRTWLFFELFVGPDDHWLPPDHFEEHPRGASAPYTSPTNIGFLLLSTLAAYDLGYIGSPILVTRLHSTFDSLARLERHCGHFLNWYDTRTLEPLPPRYVSTVDSGNLAACLVTLRQALPGVRSVPLLRWERWQGLADTLSLLNDFTVDSQVPELKEAAASVRGLTEDLRRRLLSAEHTPRGWMVALEELAGPGWEQLDRLLSDVLDSQRKSLGSEPLRRLRIATGALSNQIFTLRRYVRLLMPWLLIPDDSPVFLKRAELPAEVADAGRRLAAFVDINPSLEQHGAACGRALEIVLALEDALGRLPESPELVDACAWCRTLRESLEAARTLSEELLRSLDEVDRQANEYFAEMDFRFLFDQHRQVFHIGYNVTSGRLDDNYYDLLASEARIASVVALAKNQAPRTHWLHLARPLTQLDGTRVLLSWSATMFEYMMPRLFMRSYPGTLLYESEAAAVAHQVEYGRRRGVPWGISESGYYAFDASFNYQYRAFGVPGLGFKRDLAEDLVIAPYASFLALPEAPAAVAANAVHLSELGALGAHGYYEALDFTQARLSLGMNHAVVREYMAHHQGMILIALANHLQADLMVRRFHADPRVRAVELLLQERVPLDAPLEFPQPEDSAPVRRSESPVMTLPWAVPPDGHAPLVHYLSNGRYGVLITASGAGLSRWGDLDLTRWRADTTLDDWGAWIYLQDVDSGSFWSATAQPAGTTPSSQATRFFAHMAEFQRTDDGLASTMQVTVAPHDDVEIRRVALLNQGGEPRRIALTSYGEIVMAPQLTDERHPAFNKLFIESEYLPDLQALVFRRRPRSESEAPVYVAHVLAAQSPAKVVARSYESDRARFLGRGGSVRAPAALTAQRVGLSETSGATLDPVMSLQAEIIVDPGETVEIAFVTLAADDRGALLNLAARYSAWSAIEQTFAESRTEAELELTTMALSTTELERYQSLLSVLLYPSAALRPDPAVLAANSKGQSGLWAYGISGDYPILLVRIQDEDDLPFVHELLQAHVYWRRRQLKIDLVVLNERAAGYSQELRDQLHRMLVQMQSETWLNQRGGIFIINAGQVAEVDRYLLLTAARAVLDAKAGTLAGQLQALRGQPHRLPPLSVERQPAEQMEDASTQDLPRPSGLSFDNGLGGFADGEYVMYLRAGESTPAPWVNVIANSQFGFLVSEAGSGYTWALNSGENRLTPWSNDPVSDTGGEALYLRDEETGEVWTPTPGPAPAGAAYLVRHGAGYSTFEHHSHGLEQRLRMYAAPDAPAKIVRLHVRNTWSRTRRITVTLYGEWVLGVSREAAQQYVVSEYDDDSQTLLARNAYNAEFGSRVAFATASKRLHGLTADRTEFLGRLGSRTLPAALTRIGLESRVGAGLDPCAALQVHLDIPPEVEEEVWFVLGEGADRAESLRLAAEYKELARVEQAWQATAGFWDKTLETVQVHTPDPAMDLLLNRWLLYQALACRIWGRSALYQSSGAYGFRDQLQDVMVLIHAAPEIAREQILEAAQHQFEAGDVLHWWHPPSGRGVRTRCSDDLLWLPYVTAHYVTSTGDASILDEESPFLRAAPLKADEEDRYGEYPATPETYTLYEHCRRALERGTTAGPHGLPLMGTGDWNDGMNRVGANGKGESIWLGWFLNATLGRFADIAAARGESELATAYREQAAGLSTALEQNGWDGAWYLRAYYDSGAALGSARSDECQIDSIAQSWAVLSGAGDRERSKLAMGAVLERLVRADDGLLLLFTPPFDKTPRDPGYIKGYLPGIRENGGQYTHAAIWAVWAFVELGEVAIGEQLFSLLNPINHADTAAKVANYMVEPYVIAADVYGAPPHTGRGGWTWYTGSAAWMYRLGLEGILGIRRVADALEIDPRIPADWPGYRAEYRYGGATYEITVGRATAGGKPGLTVTLDGRPLTGNRAPLEDDGRGHTIVVEITGGS